MTEQEKAREILTRWRGDPKFFIQNILGVEQTWTLQDELSKAIPTAIRDHKSIYIGSGHALGKDYYCSAISLWFLNAYEKSIVIQTAPTDRQVKKVMWGDTLQHWNNKKIDLGGTPYANPYLEIRKADWYLIGFTTKESGASSEGGGKFSGFHSPNMCIIVSEAQAIEETIFDQIDGVAASAENCLVIFIGNPTRAKGRFAKGLKDKQNNIVFNFSCLENPNYLQRRTVIPGLASYEWVEDKRKKWGEDDPRWYGRVLGQIPMTQVSNVFYQELIDHMISRNGMRAQHSMNSGVAVDPAGEGVDENVFFAGTGGEVLNEFVQTNMPPSVSALQAVKMCKQVGGNFITVDCDGLGIGVYQELNKLDAAFLNGIQIIKFHGSSRKVTEQDAGQPLYENMRAEAAFITQLRAKEGRAAINPDDTELIEDLMEEECFTNKRGLIQIEPKEDIKERLDRSPNRGDAYKMLQWSFEQDYKPSGKYDTTATRRPQYAITDYNIDGPVIKTRNPAYAIHD